MRVRSVGLLVLAGLSTQFGAAFASTLFDRLGPDGTVFARLLLASAILLVVWPPRLRGRPRRELGEVLLFGLAFGLMNIGFYNAIARQPLGPTVTLEFLGPLAIAVWGSRRTGDLVWVAFAAAGVALLGGGGTLTVGGTLFALLAAFGWGAYILLTARIGRDWPGASGLGVGMAFAALLTAPAGIAQAGGELLVPALVASALVVAVASSVVPYSAEMFALRSIPPHVFSVLMSLEPVMACLAGLIVLGEGLSAMDLVAVGCIVVASGGATHTATRPGCVVPG